jgi:hypothetical protein
MNRPYELIAINTPENGFTEDLFAIHISQYARVIKPPRRLRGGGL